MSLVWQSSGFWLMICAVLLLLVACTALRGRMPVIVTTSPHDFTLTITPFPTDFVNSETISTHIPPLSMASDQIYERSTLPPPETGIIIDTPICYALSGGQYSCLGQIWNYSDAVLGDTSIELAFYNEDGTQIGTQIATSEQRITSIGSFAPFHATISADLTEGITDRTQIVPKMSRNLPSASNIQTLSIVEARGGITTTGRYSLTVTILNDSGQIASDIRLFTTLDGNEWGVVGYNVYEVEDPLNNGERQLIQQEIIPHALPDNIVHFLHVEARIGD